VQEVRGATGKGVLAVKAQLALPREGQFAEHPVGAGFSAAPLAEYVGVEPGPGGGGQGARLSYPRERAPCPVGS